MTSTGSMRQESALPVSLFAVAIFVSAFLIFQVQPMVGKRIVPWFGGGPSVWTLCLMFYQVTLFLGYAYAHALVRFARPGLQFAVHAVLLGAALLALPVLPGVGWKPATPSDPTAAILSLLLVNVALPFIALAATGPLVQAWFSRRHPQRSPYPLYAVSNLGSLAALLAFPTLIEPRLSLVAASGLWSAGFAIAAVSVLSCGFSAARAVAPRLDAATEREGEAGEEKANGRFALWLLLAASAVVMLMAVTNELCLNLASVPFLWILPLGLYLLSFILCFGSERAYRKNVYLPLAGLALLVKHVLPHWLAPTSGGALLLDSVNVQIVLYSLILFSHCMLLHGELYRRRPPARSLTAFYLGVSGGGALGGLFVGLLAPRIFAGYYELSVGYAATWMLMLWTIGRGPTGAWPRGAQLWRTLPVIAGVLLALGWLLPASLREPNPVIHHERSFFGVIRVVELDASYPQRSRRALRHGTTVHGVQLQDPALRMRPTSYYGPVTGIGLALARRSDAPESIGVVGLGAGTLAAYGRPGDRFRFYEIDSAVIRIARDSGYFSFLSETPAAVEVVVGDGRLSLESEAAATGGNDFDFLIIDAFSSDAIPVHLLTLEAIELFARHVKPDDLLAIHASNVFFDFRPILARIAGELNLEFLTVVNRDAGLQVAQPSRWVLLAHDPARLASVRRYAAAQLRALGLKQPLFAFGKMDPALTAAAPLWTDDYSSLWGLIETSRAAR